MLWAALTLSHYGLFCSSKLAQPKLAEARVAQFIRVWDVTPHFLQGCLHYICVNLSSCSMDPFQLGCPVIIVCTGMAVCGACEAWHIIQDHRQTQTPPDVPFLQVDGRALDQLMLVRHIITIAAKLGLNPSRYSGHSLCIGGATSAAQAGALPMANKSSRLVEQSGLSTVHMSGPACVHKLCCPHESQFVMVFGSSVIKTTR